MIVNNVVRFALALALLLGGGGRDPYEPPFFLRRPESEGGCLHAVGV